MVFKNPKIITTENIIKNTIKKNPNKNVEQIVAELSQSYNDRTVKTKLKYMEIRGDIKLEENNGEYYLKVVK